MMEQIFLTIVIHLTALEKEENLVEALFKLPEGRATVMIV